ncbi:MAG: CocE/NonD family hydrolase [Dehalococcoidales bacterium]|nr:CocE/NonD family hydrolase [Dehalococcoidales bacterium]
MTKKPSRIIIKRRYRNNKIEVIYRKTNPIANSNGKFPPLTSCIKVEEGIIIERDVPVNLRDGTIIYTDVYRPEGASNIPAIVAWSPYGKRSRYTGYDTLGVPPLTVSPMAKDEGPDPAFWCKYGYAVVNPDPRGVGNSQGNIVFLGTAEGKDCYDLIEWVAMQEWCSGKIGMSGNSWLAMIQWFTATEQPSHLTAIAPWEGATDLYRDILCRGGIPETGFTEGFYSFFYGPAYSEDIIAMIHKYPFMNSYWEDKIPYLNKINIPAYITAGWSHFHLRGSIEAFRKITSPNKWLRIHRDFEWPDYYTPNNLKDLRDFFDRYLKGIRNGWEMMAPVRLDVMDVDDSDYQVNRCEKEFPLERTQYRRLFLDAKTGHLSNYPVKKESYLSYESTKQAAKFTIEFKHNVELTGYMKLRLWVEADGADDMDIFVNVQKLSKKGDFLPTFVLGQSHPGASGLLRVSHREIDKERSTPAEPVLTHSAEQLLKPGEIVPIEIGIWPSSKYWYAGQKLSLAISGHYIRDSRWFEPFRWELCNRGNHVIHTGGKFDSYLLIPVIPPKPR